MERSVLMLAVVFLLTATGYAGSLNCLKLGYYHPPGYVFGVAVSGDYAYLADANAGLRGIEFYGGNGVAECPALMAHGKMQ